MEAIYLVISKAGRMTGDYTQEVCSLFNSYNVLSEGNVNIPVGPNNVARFMSRDETVVDIYRNSSENDITTVIGISRHFEEPLEESEKRVLNLRRELSSILSDGGLMIH